MAEEKEEYVVQLPNGKWVFIDETWNYSIDYDTKKDAESALNLYVKEILR